jgi:hypothetical protein
MLSHSSKIPSAITEEVILPSKWNPTETIISEQPSPNSSSSELTVAEQVYHHGFEFVQGNQLR